MISVVATLVASVAVVLAAIAARLWWILPGHPGAPIARPPGRGVAVRTMIVLGSGGHTTEMFQLLSGLDRRTHYTPRQYIVAATDAMGRSKIDVFEGDEGSRGRNRDDVFVHTIPRSREVKQSWITTIGTTAHALVVSLVLVLRLQPDLVLCNGPGTCVPICIAAYVLRFIGIRSVSIVYVESFARVKHLSLSGRLLYPFADMFFVQWPQLLEKWPRARYLGILV